MGSSMEGYGLSLRGAANVEAIWPKISKAVAEREKKENPCIDMGTSENWVIRDEVIKVYQKALQDNLAYRHLSYPDGFNGDSDLLDALAAFINSYFKPFIPVLKEHLATAPGAAFSLDALLYNICQPGDGLLVIAPCWNGFDWLLNVRSSVQPVFVTVGSFDEVFTSKIVPALENAFRESTRPIKGLLFTNPHNPFGKCYPKDIIIDIIKFCDSKKIHFISDELYAMSSFLNPEMPSPLPFVSTLQLDIQGIGCDLSRIHTIWSTSKDLGSSGLRMGCCVTQRNKPLATGLALVSNTQMSSLTAVATASILTSPELPRLFALNSQRLAEAYERTISMLKKHGLHYITANMGPFMFVKIAPGAKSWDDEMEVVQACKEAGVSVSAGRSYHVPESEKGWARLNYAIKPADLDEALRRLATVLGRGKKLQNGDTHD
ncbi:PLP-dependent transferase [Annulohypoxylon moriforme]|nr:PLP-dependent transferase [Annulohypoxylon moriforme]